MVTSQMIPKLETERLVLLPWKLEYAEDMLLFAANENVTQAREVRLITNLNAAKAKIKNYIDNNIDDWAIALKTENGNRIIGSIGIYKHAKSWRYFNKFNLSFNLVYLIAEEYWGQGVCTEAAQKVMHYAFIGIKCDALGANHRSWNNRSQRVIEKCKFKKIKDDTNTAQYYITREDYLNLHNISEGNLEYGFVDLSKYEQKARSKMKSQRQPNQAKGSPNSLNNPIRKITSISYIKEPTGYLCGQSCVAMLANVSVDEVIKVLGTDKGTSKHDLKKGLNYYGIRHASGSTKYDLDVPLPNLCIIRMMLPGYGHWGIYYNGVYYDPEFGVLDKCPPNAIIFQVWEIYP